MILIVIIHCNTGHIMCLYYSSGEAMEKGLRDCCRSIRIGKILIKINEESKMPMVNNEPWLE